MLENLFTYPAVRARHKKAPLFEERDCYLAYRAKEQTRMTMLEKALMARGIPVFPIRVMFIEKTMRK